MRSHTEFSFEIETGPELPEEQWAPLGPAAELVPFVPKLVEEAEVIGRVVEEISLNVGTYGMGGTGFVGLRLGAEWLTIALWSASCWLRFNDRILHNIHHRPEDGSPPWDQKELTKGIVGLTITAFAVGPKSMDVTFSDGSVLRIDESPDMRPIFPGTGTPRAFSDTDDLRRVVFLMPDRTLWV